MDVFGYLSAALALVPQWVAYLLLPALLAGYALAVTLFGGRRSYPYLWAVIGGTAVSVTAVRDPGEAIVLAALYVGVGGLLSLLFLLPEVPWRARKRRRRERAACLTERSEGPVKVCGPSEARYAPELCGIRLAYADDLLVRIKKASLSAADRLEAETLERALGGLRGRLLSEEELGRLNDVLASVLKLMAKYKL